MRKVAGAFAVFFLFIGMAMGEQFLATIKMVKGDKISVSKIKKGEKGFEQVEATLIVSAQVKILRGAFNKDTKMFETGEPVEGGLRNEMFSKGNVVGFITTNGEGIVTQVVVGGQKKKRS